jgi:hypothetical protein
MGLRYSVFFFMLPFTKTQPSPFTFNSFTQLVRRIVQVSHKAVKFACRYIPEQYRPIALRQLAPFSMVERSYGSVILTDSVKHETWRKNKGAVGCYKKKKFFFNLPLSPFTLCGRQQEARVSEREIYEYQLAKECRI